MAANLITYADGVVTPFLDGIMQELYTSGGGIITGGTITISGASTLHITQTHGALCGREFSIDDGDYAVPLSSSGTKLGRMYLHMDLANTATPLEVLIETGSALTPVVQDDDVNETNGIYEINLALFEVDESTIKNLEIAAPVIKSLADKTLQTLNDCELSTDPQDIAGAAVIRTLNSNISNLIKYTDAHIDLPANSLSTGQWTRYVLSWSLGTNAKIIGVRASITSGADSIVVVPSSATNTAVNIWVYAKSAQSFATSIYAYVSYTN